MAEALSDRHCVACAGDAPKLPDAQINLLMRQVPEWVVVEEDAILRLHRIFEFRNWAESMAFVARVSELAEAEQHHPAIGLEWGKVVVWWWTHKIRGLHENDFIAAAHTDRLYGR
ncbi:MAG: 4a-hydroxytetrahydrobiopterin dehydratase, partial [Gammaproteobacteria bacterium]